jgi:hypothetical protein
MDKNCLHVRTKFSTSNRQYTHSCIDLDLQLYLVLVGTRTSL